MFMCRFCQRTTDSANSTTNHELRCKHNVNRIVSGPAKGTPSKQIGVPRPDIKGRKFGVTLTGHSSDTKKKLSLLAIARGLGGRVEGLGARQERLVQGILLR